MKQYKKYVLGGVFVCLMAVALMAPVGKSEAFWPFSKVKKENNANYTGAVANTEGAKVKPASSITVVSPNGGETLQAGKSYRIKWKTRGFSRKAVVGITLLTAKGETEMGTVIAENLRNKGSYAWKVPVDISGGDSFLIQIHIKEKNTSGLDQSDGEFKIIGVTRVNAFPKIEEVSIRKAEWEGDIHVGDNVLLTAKAFDSDNDDLSWGIDWGDGSGMKSVCETDHKQNRKDWEFETRHIWEKKGTYTVGVTVSDCRGGSDKEYKNINIESI